MSLVTLEQVNHGLTLDLQGTAPDYAADARSPAVLLAIEDAEAAVLDFVQPQPDPAWAAETVPGEVRRAIILAAGYFMDDTPEAHEALAALAGHDLNHRSPLVGLLRRHRDPSMA